MEKTYFPVYKYQNPYPLCNTHVSTRKLTVAVRNIGLLDSLPDLHICKPFGSVPDWSDTAGSRTIDISPINDKILAKAGLRQVCIP